MNNSTTKAGWRERIAARLTARFTAYLVTISVVTAVAAVNSYIHQYEVGTWLHQSGLGASTLPLSVDGLLAVAALAIADDKAQGRLPRTWARIAFWLGALVSIAANIASVGVGFAGTHATGYLIAGGIAWSAWPSLALLVVVEVMAKQGKPRKAPARVEGGRKAAQTRKAKATTTTVTRARKPRAPRAPAAAQVSPATVSEIDSIA